MRALRIWFLLAVSFTLYSCGKTDGVAPSQPAAAGSVSISPASVVLAINNSFTFSATGGTPPYFYTLVTGSGSISSTTGVFNAPGVAGLASVRVTDSLGTVSDATITINAGLQISPTAQSLSINQTLSYSASGGVAPFVYSIVSGVGSINASSGLYTAPASSGSANVRVTDSLGNTSNATVNVFSALGIAPTPITIAVNNTVNFSAGGGTGPYTYSVFSGGGTVNASTGVYTAPGASGSATVRVTDSLGATASATITINAALAISPVSQTTLINSTISFSASGGVTPYSYSIISGSGSINAISGSYTAPAANGSATIRVTDNLGNTSNAVVTITTALSIAPASVTLAVGNTQTFTGAGGTPPFSFSKVSGVGAINASTGVYTASGGSGVAVVRVTDNLGATADANITINAALAISPVSQTTLINSTLSFSGSGGVSPYSFSIVSGGGSINASTGSFTAPVANGTTVVRVTDSFGNTANATVTVTTALILSPSSITLAVSNTTTFTAAGGTGPFTYSVSSGTGSINPSSGVYTAPVSSGSAVVTVTDSLGATATASVTINSALAISPVSQTMSVNGTLNFSASNGVGPYSYSMVSGGGSVVAATGVYTAPAVSGSATVRVTDSLGNTANSSLTITSGLGITPASTTLAVNNSATFSSLGGSAPYTYSVFSGGGSVTAGGVYTAPAAAGSAVVRVTDNLGATANASVTINAALAISPASKTLAVTNTFTFSSTGGVSPFTFSVVSGTGTVNASTGLYTAPGLSGSATVRVTDGLGNTSNAAVTINAALAISPVSQTVLVNSINTFTGSNGVAPYTYSVFSGGGSINPSTGAYTAPPSNGSATIRVTDNYGNTADAAVTITSPLSVSPSSVTLAVNNTQTFSGVGGTSPYTFSVFSGTGTINSSTGVYTAPASAGSAVVRVTDNLGATASATVTINAALAISPTTVTLSPGGTQTFTTTGGVSPFTFSVFSGGGTINSASGLYTASSAGAVTVRVTDSLGNTSDAAVTVNGALAVTPISAYVVVNADLPINATGGVPPYSYAMVTATPSTGIVDIVTGVYTAPATPSSATVRTTDSAGVPATADTTITVYNSLTLSPLTLTMAINTTQTFTAAGGVGARTFSVASGAGTINSSTGLYTAPGVAGTTIINVTDTIGNVVAATVTVVSQLTITPSTLKLPIYSTMTFTSVLGSSPYSYSVFAGSGTINSGTGLYTAPVVSGTGTVRVTDSISNTADSALTHIEPVEITSGASHTCIRYSEGSVKCFGAGASGQLGNGSTTDLGDTSNELGGNLPFVNLGTGRTAKALAAGFSHTCALLDNNSVKCWGLNSSGQLGIGSTANMGDGANEMGDNLPAVNLGTGRTATKIFAFGYVSCALLDNGAAKCWGKNTTGQLGLGDAVNRGTSAAQMGDNLLSPNLGAGRTVTKFSGGFDFSCALLDNGTVKCYGAAKYGQTGYDTTVTLGDSAAEMTALAAVNLGAGRTATDIGMGYSHSCAVLDNGTVKCWGRNAKGQLGIESTAQAIGTSSGDMAGLISAPLTSYTPVKVYGGNQMTCVVNVAGNMRCWGLNGIGQLLVGNTSNIGRNNNDIVGLGNVNFGTSVVANQISVGYYNGCALTTGKQIKCWGSALYGALANGSTVNNLGGTAGTIGNGLPYVNH